MLPAVKVDEAFAARVLGIRGRESNKGDFGYIGLVGGSREYGGAVKLANLAATAMRAGAGVVRLVVPEGIAPAVAPYLIENPVSTISTYWRKPDFTFDPCDYAGYPGGENDLYTKKTCLWTGGGFIMPPPKRLEPVQGSRMHRLPPSPERANLRSATPMGFARAVFEANCPGWRSA